MDEKTLDTGPGDPVSPPATADQRIQFAPDVRLRDTRRPPGDDGLSISIAPRSSRQSVVSIPQVISEKEKERREREKTESKNVDIDEHLMTHEAVAERYKTGINMEKPGDSFGLTSTQAAELLQQHGANVLTPPKKRHPFLKFLDCLRSLFNLLLIFAGILEYVLLGIDYKNNFQNVSCLVQS